MAGTINKYQEIKSLTGMDSGSDNGVSRTNQGIMPSLGAQMSQGGDNVPAMVQPAKGGPAQPAALKEGEIVFSIPSIVGAGKGDFNKGAEMLLELHKQLKGIGENFLSKEAKAGPTPGIAQVGEPGVSQGGLPGIAQGIAAVPGIG